MRTDHSPGVPSGRRSTARATASLVAATAVLCLTAAPAAALTSTAPHATPSPSCGMPPCVGPLAAELALALTVDRPTAAVGDTVTYTITIGNTGSLPASAVTVDDVLGGDAGYLVEDGTAGTADTFLGAPLATITRVLAGHYRWSYAIVSPGDNDVVRFSAVIRLPSSAASATPGMVVLSSTASTAGVPAASVTTTVSLPAGVGGGGGTPPTGSSPTVVAGFLLLGGLGLILVSAIVRRREELAAGEVARRPARSR